MNLNKVISISQPAFVYISMIAFFFMEEGEDFIYAPQKHLLTPDLCSIY